MSQSPLRAEGSKSYADAWRAINILIRSDGTWSGRERNLCFRNRGDGAFDDISFVSGLDLDADGRAFVPLDLDADGDLDLILKNRNGRQLRAFRNDMRQAGGRSLAIRLQGRKSNRDGVGGRVWVETDRRTLMREIVSGSGYLSQRARQAWFGLQAGETVRSLRVRWPIGASQHVDSPPQAGSLILVEGESSFLSAAPIRHDAMRSELAGATEAKPEQGTLLAEPVPAPDFELRKVGEPSVKLRLSSLRGRPVLLNFWATWCPPCRRELSRFQSSLSEFRRLGIEVLAVSVDEQEQYENVSALASELSVGFPVLLADTQTAETYSVLNERLFDRRRALAIPTSFLLNPDGQIVRIYRGEVAPEQVLRAVGEGGGDALPFEGRWMASRPRRDFEELASAFAERGLGSAAMAMFEEALETGDRSPRLLNNMAGALIASDVPERGEALLREALAADPAMTDAKVNLATLLLGRGEGDEAEMLLEEALASQPRDSQTLSVLGSIRFAQGRLDEAEDLFQRAVDERPDDARVRENLGAALASQGRFARALEHYEWALGLGAEGATFHTNLAVLYMQAGQAERALESFLRAVEEDPSDPGAHLNLARYRLQAADLDAASESIRRAKELAPDAPQVLLLEAQALAMRGLVQEARGLLEDFLRRNPDSTEATRLLEALQ